MEKKEIKLLLIAVLFFCTACAQKKDLDYASYEISNKILLDGIQECISLNKDSKNLSNAVILVAVNSNSDTTRYLIHYAYSSFTFELFPPTLISRIGKELVYFSYCSTSDAVLKKEILDKIIKEQFPKEYEFSKRKEANEFSLDDTIDNDYSVLLTLKNGKLQQKNIFKDAYDICGGVK